MPNSISPPGSGSHSRNDKLIILRLEGNLVQQGFSVIAEFGFDETRATGEYRGYLPPAPDVLERLEQWRQNYHRLEASSRLSMRLTPHEISYSGSVNDPFEHCRQLAEALQILFCQWLLRADEFQTINLRLREFCNLEDRIRVLIQATDPDIRRLPWHCWDFIDRYQGAEVAFTGVTADQYPVVQATADPQVVRILAILGDPADIDVDGDRALLNALPNADVTFLVQPDRTVITDQLWQQSWDILFFAGHSKTKRQGDRLDGHLSINATDTLSLAELTFGLRQAMRQGLQLAIFNSCDGLGLAAALEQLHLPQFIVMREPIPDKVAQTFLNRFLQAFSSGSSFYRSVRQAREQLQGMEDDYPCASWLPVIYQTGSARSLHWADFLQPPLPTPPPLPPSPPATPSPPHPSPPHSSLSHLSPPHPLTPSPSRLIRYSIHCGIGLAIASFVIGIRTLGWLQPLELKAYDHLMTARPHQRIPDNRLLVVSIDEEDIQYQRQEQMVLDGSLSDTALLSLLKRFEPHRPAAIGIDVLHDFAFEPGLATHVHTHPHIFAVCRDKTPSQPGVLPPPSISHHQLGFTNTPLDPDGIIRRQFLGESDTDGLCQTQHSLAFQLALSYLDTVAQQPMSWINPDSGLSQLRLGTTVIPHVTRRSGGYYLPDGEDGGYQVVINYRAVQPTQVTLREVLSGTLDSQLPDLVRDRVILIGVVDHKTDLHMTPYHQGTPMDAIAGVMVQAQTVSHLISAVVDNRPFIHWWSEGHEAIWILVWGLTGGLIVSTWPQPNYRWLAGVGGCIILCGGCLVLLLFQGLWVPLVPAAITFTATVAIYMPKKTNRNGSYHQR